MMIRNCRSFLVLMVLLLALAWPCSQLQAETRMAGSVGIDLTAYGFTGKSVGDYAAPTTKTNRSLSNHYVDGSMAGSLVNEKFALFNMRGLVLGAFSQSSTGDGANNFRLPPALNSYFGSVVMFPERRFPIRFYLGRQLERTLEYEAKNRTESSFERPSLSVVRRYQRESSQRGVSLNLKLASNVSVSAQTGKMESASLREYDFNEDFDIWIDITNYPPDPLIEFHTIEVVNELPNASVQVIIDGHDTILAPEQFAHLQVDSGTHSVLVLPLSIYNQFEFSTRVVGDQTWKVEYREPLSPRDQKSTEDGSRFQLEVGETGVKGFTAYYDGSNRFNPFTGQTTVRGIANNLAEYSLSDDDLLTMETGYSSNESIRESVTTQSNTTFSHETTLRHRSRRGISGMFLHEFSTANTAVGGQELESKLNRIRARASKPFRKLKYAIELETKIGIKSDNSGQATDQYDAGLSQRMEKFFGGMTWRPTNSTRYTLRDRTRPDGTSNRTKILETGFNLDGTSLKPTVLGDLTVRGSYSFRTQSDNVGSDSKELYGFEVLVSRKLATGFQVDLMAAHKWETFGGGGSVAPANPGVAVAASVLDVDHKTTYRSDISFNPSENVSTGFSYSVVTEALSEISQIGASISANLPLLNIPLVSAYSKSTRKAGDLAPQTSMSLATEVKYRYRQIQFGLEHTYAKDELIAQMFTYYEVLATVSRGFGR